jgi:hypothetical protein
MFILLILLINLLFPYNSYAYGASPPKPSLTESQIEDIRNLSIRINNFKTQAKQINIKLADINEKIRDQYTQKELEGFANPAMKNQITTIKDSLNALELEIDSLQLTLVLETDFPEQDIDKAIIDLKKKTANIKTNLIKFKNDQKSIISQIDN